MQGFFHGWVAELEPLLHEMDAQQGLHRKRLLAPAPTFGCVGLYQRDQLSPGHHQFHGIKEFTLARALGGVAQAQAALLHGLIVWASAMSEHTAQGFVQRDPSDLTVNELMSYKQAIQQSGDLVAIHPIHS